MEKQYDSFDNFHPLVNFSYFLAVIVFTMFLPNPIIQAIGFLGASSYIYKRRGLKDGLRFQLRFILPVLLVTIVINPLLNHRGVSILAYLPSGNPLTLESILYGISSGFMFVTIIMWFDSYNKIMTSDKTMDLFGRLMPSLTLIFSMVLRFIPRYLEKLREIVEAQRALGRDIGQGSLREKVRNSLTVLSILTSWALENSIDTADSMRARGYGLKGRTSYKKYRLSFSDKFMLILISSLSLLVLYGSYKGVTRGSFFPSLNFNLFGILNIVVYLGYILLCLLPVIINIQEELEWKYIESQI